MNTYQRAVDEALVSAHLGVANDNDGYDKAKKKLDELIQWHIDVATDPAVNGGFELKPVQTPPLTYYSTQATICACCGKHKHTPLRIDKMGGYVCLTCIDQKLGSLLGEFGRVPVNQNRDENESN